jgi:signal transduction histidine kinase/CheY-like chemotaxis protein
VFARAERHVAYVLRNFISVNREEILSKARDRVASRSSPLSTEAELSHGLPVFLDQLDDALRKVTLHEVVDHGEIKTSAGHYGDDLFRQGLTVAQVINGYGDLCQVITGLAVDQKVPISATEFQTLNLCLDEATAGAVTAYTTQHDRMVSDEGTERLGVLAHEMRNALNTAILAVGSIKKGSVGLGGSTGAMLDRSHMRLQSLIDQSLADVRLDAGLKNLARVPVCEVIEEAEIGGAMIAQARGIHFVVTTVDPSVVVEADRPILAAAVANLLQNAFKFTLPGTTVKLRASSTTSRVLIDVEDECGGLPAGAPQSLLRPFAQKGRDRTGLGLGLSICTKAVKMMAGELHIRDLPGKGCVFTLDLPKQPPSPTSIHAHHRRDPNAQGGPGGNSGRARDATTSNVLIVDDDFGTVEMLSDALRESGYLVQTARTGEEGLQVLRSKPLPDAILLDVDMPVLGGPGMAHKMMLHDAGEERIPIVLSSGRPDLPALAAAMGTPYFIGKPVELDHLLALLARALVERAAPKSA